MRAVALASAITLISLTQAGAFAPPPEPEIAPIINPPVDVDLDASRIDDRLESAIAQARATLAEAVAPEAQRTAARRILEEPQPVELVFAEQITQPQIDAFLKAGGSIDHIFTHVSYGWTGALGLEQIEALPALMGDSLVGVVGRKAIQKHMDEAGRTGRVRPMVWDLGYDGDSEGTDRVTIAILDDGIDDSHTDLAGRMAYWKDWTIDNHAAPQSLGHHGAHVAGIALGSGAAAGVNPGAITFSTLGDLPETLGSFAPSPIHVPTSVSSMNWTSTMRWVTGGGITARIGLVNSDSSGGWGLVGSTTTGTGSPLVYTRTGQANPFPGRTNRWSPYATKSAGAGRPRYAVSTSVSYAGVGDGYNVFRGVAPDSQWAGLKVFEDDGSGNSGDFDEALDDIVAQCNVHNIRVANMSLGITGDPGISITTRDKANTAVSNGIVVVVSAGNDGDGGTAGERAIDDPGRAHFCITVGASNDINQVTSYSSEGFAAPGDGSLGDEDTKPDLVAPGGSGGHSMIMSVDSNDGDSEDSTGTQFSDAVANDYYNIQGTSMAAPFVAGAAALVIDAMQQAGTPWGGTLQDALTVKAILLLTATETNQARESGSGSGNPTLNRGAKDTQEGYGMINVDAAVDAARGLLFTGSGSDTFGSGAFDKRCWARKAFFTNIDPIPITLTVPATGDFDLYFYSIVPGPYGNPVILFSSTSAGAGTDEQITIPPSVPAPIQGYLVVKRVSGSGAFSISGATAGIGDWHLFTNR